MPNQRDPRGCSRLCAATLVLALVLSAAWSPRARAIEDTTCPLRFDTQTTGLPIACLFVGTVSSCDEPIVAVFGGDGEMLVVGLAAGDREPRYIAGSVLSETEATLLDWHSDEALESVGSARLENDGRQLRIRLDSAIQLDMHCPADEQVIEFAAMVDSGSDGRPLGL